MARYLVTQTLLSSWAYENWLKDIGANVIN